MYGLGGCGMPQYLIYGKKTKPLWHDKKRRWVDSDKTFKAINEYGVRVNKLSDAFSFASREDAQEFLNAHKPKDGVIFEIRKVRS